MKAAAFFTLLAALAVATMILAAGRTRYFSESVGPISLCQPQSVIWQDRDVTIIKDEKGAWVRVYQDLRPITWKYHERCMAQVAADLGLKSYRP